MKAIKALVAVSATGKSFLADLYPNRFIDIDKIELAYAHGLPLHLPVPEDLWMRGLPKLNPNHRTFAFRQAIDALELGKILLFAPHRYYISFVRALGVPWCFVTRKAALDEEYAERQRNRKNPELFIQSAKPPSMDFIQAVQPTTVCILESGQYLSDLFQEKFLI